VKNVCADCFLEKNRIAVFEPKVAVPVCRECGKILRLGKWVPQTDDHVVEIAKAAVKAPKLSDPVLDIGIEPLGEGKSLVAGTVAGKIDGFELKAPFEFELVPKYELCRNCSLLRADYYEAKIQLRFASKDKSEWTVVVDEIEARLDHLFATDSLSKLAKKELVPNGVDLWIGSKRAAKTIVYELARRANTQPVTSSTLAGVDKSGRVKKTFTFLLRVP
ncbi:MAG: NMD3-related protein, partial [Candidatus Diapherotrites archaeon]|nr:NMD3-related protein [Candidatus Diapherotrites archaeon]